MEAMTQNQIGIDKDTRMTPKTSPPLAIWWEFLTNFSFKNKKLRKFIYKSCPTLEVRNHSRIKFNISLPSIQSSPQYKTF